MIEALIQFPFMRYAFISGLVIGFLAPVLGVFIVVRRLSMIADALSHITLSGIAFSLLLGKHVLLFTGLHPIYMGMTFSVIGALSIERLRRTYKHYQELAIPIILSAGIGSGVVFISLADGFNVDLFQFLFGSIIATRRADMITISIIGVVVVTAIILMYKELFSLSFDDENARTTGLPRKTLNIIFIIMVAVVVAASMRIVGVLLVSSLMVLPVAASIKVAGSFKQTFFYAILFGELAVLGGLVLSFVFNIPPGGTIVALSLFILGLVIAAKKWVWKTD